MVDVSVHLVVVDPVTALAWYQEVFEAREVNRILLPDGKPFAIEFTIGNTHLHLAGEYPDMGILSPTTLGGTYMALQLETDDVDDVYQRAISAGATVFHPLDDAFYGDRTGQFIDPFGHRWGVCKHLRDVPADEIARELARTYGNRPQAQEE